MDFTITSVICCQTIRCSKNIWNDYHSVFYLPCLISDQTVRSPNPQERWVQRQYQKPYKSVTFQMKAVDLLTRPPISPSGQMVSQVSNIKRSQWHLDYACWEINDRKKYAAREGQMRRSAEKFLARLNSQNITIELNIRIKKIFLSTFQHVNVYYKFMCSFPSEREWSRLSPTSCSL